MLNLQRSKIRRTKMVPALASEVGSIAEGQPLRGVLVSGVGYGARSNAETDQLFLGVAAGPVRGVTNIVKTATAAPVTGALTVTLPRLVVGTNISVEKADGTRLTVIDTGSPASGEVKVADNSDGTSDLTFNTAQAGVVYYVIYATLAKQSDIVTSWPGHPGVSGPVAEDQLGVIPVISEGEVAVDNFAPGEDWSFSADDAQLKIGATGLFLPGGSSTAGTAIKARIVRAPTYADPVLIVDLG